MRNLNGPPMLDWVMCPLVEFNPEIQGGSPVLRGTRLPADTIVGNYLAGSPIEEIEENFDVPRPTILAVLRYAATRIPGIEL